ncbi:MAG: hypothetical protein RR496_03270, partial [Lachnospiraceae bacterium]
YTNKILTEEIQLSKNAIGNYKSNNVPNAMILLKLSQKLGVSMEYLLTGETTEQMKLSENEKELIDNFSLLPEREQIKFIGKIEDIAKQYKETAGRLSNSKIG